VVNAVQRKELFELKDNISSGSNSYILVTNKFIL